MKKFFIFILLFFISTNIKAYENNYFKIDIPNNYKDEIIKNNIYKWSNEHEYISISIEDNSNLKYSIEAYTNDDIENQKKYIEEKINNSLKDYNITVNVSNIEKVFFNNNYILEYNIFWPTKDIIGYDTYQIGNVYTTKNYIITMIYSTDTKINNEDYSQIKNSFIIKDKKTKVITFKELIVIMVTIGSIIAILKVIFDQKKSN